MENEMNYLTLFHKASTIGYAGNRMRGEERHACSRMVHLDMAAMGKRKNALTPARRSGMALDRFVRSVPARASPPAPKAASRRGHRPVDALAPPPRTGTDTR